MPHFLRYRVPLRDGMPGSDRNAQVGVQAMAQPSGPNVRHLFDAFGVARRISNFVDDCMLDGVEPAIIDEIRDAGEDRLARLPHDLSDRDRDEKSDDRVGERITEPDADGAKEDGETGQAVDPCMVAVGDQSGALDLPSGFDAKHRRDLVPGEANDRRPGDGPKIIDVLRMQEPLNRFVARSYGAEGDDEHNYDAGQILHAAVAVGESFAWFPA